MARTYSLLGKSKDAAIWRLIVNAVDTEEDAIYYAKWLSKKYPHNIYQLEEDIGLSSIIRGQFVKGKRV